MDHIEREEPEPHLRTSTNRNLGTSNQRLSILIRDESHQLFKVRDLQDSDVIVLLTPVVPPISLNPAEASDPFESFENSLSNRHPWIDKISYNERDGITETHTSLIERSQAVVICFTIRRDEGFPTQIVKDLSSISDEKTIIIIVCCKPLDLRLDIPFPTVIQTFGYSPAALEATAVLIFGENPFGSAISLYSNAPTDTRVPRVWSVQEWDRARDMVSIMTLWRQCVGPPFLIDPDTLGTILECPKYNKNFVVRHSISGDTLGFCATHLSPADRDGTKYVACLALIFVHYFYRDEGIGTSLYRCAIEELRKAHGVVRIQLGSSFPRILYGPLQKMTSYDKWFRHRSWQFYRNLPGSGRDAYDLILDSRDWSYDRLVSSSFCFRESTKADKKNVLNFLGSSYFDEYVKMGWYDQYMKILNGPKQDEIIIALEDEVIVAIALTYTSHCYSEARCDLPWAGIIGQDIGGLTCVFLPTDKVVTTKTEIRNGLINIAMSKLKNQNNKRLLWDAVVDDIDDLKKLGFQEWARYREVWRDLKNMN